MEDPLALPGTARPAAEPAPEPAAAPRTWEEMFPRRPKPEEMPYGFLSARGEPVGSSRETLLRLARTRTIPLVWSPETAEMVPPWEVPFLLDAMRGEIAAGARKERRQVAWGAAVVILLLLVFLPRSVALIAALLVTALVMVLIVMITRRIEQAARTGPEEFKSGVDAVLEHQAELAQPIPATRAVALAVAATGVSQILFLDASVDAGAVSRQAVAAGDWWRLFTAPMLHGHILHFWMNYGALDSLGRTIETRGTRWYVPLVFLVAALAGGACSILAPPDTLSVGASGGLMGMFGFLAVMAYRRRNHLPEGFLRGLLINIGLIGLVGLIAHRFIDNAAHAGGLVAGVLIGMAAVPRAGAEWAEPPLLRRAAWLAQGVIFASAALAIILTLVRVFG